MNNTVAGSQSFRRGVVFSIGFNIVSKSLLFVQGLLVGYFFGINGKTDLYFFFQSALILFSFLINSLDASVLIPESMRLRTQVSARASMVFLNFFIFLYAVLGILALVFFLLCSTEMLLLVTSFPSQVIEANGRLILIALPLFPLTILGNFFVNILTSHRYFTAPMVVSASQSAIVIAIMILGKSQISLESVLAAQVVACFLNLVVLVFISGKLLAWNFSVRGVKIDRIVLRNALFAQTGNLATFLSSYFQFYVLSGLPAGSVSTFSYAQRVSEVPTSLLTNQVSAVAGVRYNELASVKNYEKLNEIYLSSSQLLIAVLVPASMLISCYSDEIIRLLYAYGAFPDQSSELVSFFLRYLILLLPLSAIITNTSRIYMATQTIRETFYYQVISNLVLIALLFLLVRSFGLAGLPAAIIGMSVVNVLVIQIFMNRLFRYLAYRQILGFLVKAILVEGFLFLLIYQITHFFVKPTNVQIGVVGITYLGSLLAINWYFQVNGDVNKILRNIFNYVSRQTRNSEGAS